MDVNKEKINAQLLTQQGSMFDLRFLLPFTLNPTESRKFTKNILFVLPQTY